jgi:hypothetical protein
MDLAWHFTRIVDGRPVLRDGVTPCPPVGEWLTVGPPLVICERGLHASWRAIAALGFASWDNAAACLVEVDGIEAEHAEKLVCARRRIVSWVACDDLLRLFARESALSVAHPWAGPAIVREYLETGNKEISAAALAARAAHAAAWAAASAAARDELNCMLESILLAGIAV